jgi:hypothetical protein
VSASPISGHLGRRGLMCHIVQQCGHFILQQYLPCGFAIARLSHAASNPTLRDQRQSARITA